MQEEILNDKNRICLEMLMRLGVKMPVGSQPDNWLQELSFFIKSYDFMRVGQAVSQGQWQAAAMTLRRMDMKAKAVGAECFLRSFAGMKQSVARKNEAETKQILANVVVKRVRIIEALNERQNL